jgi:hypothetical protein
MAGSRRKSVIWDTISTGIALWPDVRSGSKPEKLNESKCFPLFTQQRTSPRYFGMSVSCPTTDIQADLGGLILHSQPRGRARNLSKLEASGSSERQAASALTSVPLAVILTEPSGWIRLEL